MMAAVFCCATIYGSPNGGRSAAAVKEVQVISDANPADAGLLRQAYALLARGDHDYRGHRGRAMRGIEEAGKLLGMNLRGDGRVRERQVWSDNQLRQAQGLLELVRTDPAISGSRHALKHINEAITEISAALVTR